MMNTFRKALRVGMAAALLASGVGMTTAAHSYVGGFGGFGGNIARSPLRISGSVVCTNCSLDEVRRAQPREHDLYQFVHKDGQLVFKITKVNNTTMFNTLAWPPRFWVRASDDMLRRLTAEENLFKGMEITGILSSTRTLDVSDVAISG